MKLCGKCKQVKPLSDFARHKTRGHQYRCRACQAIADKARYASDPAYEAEVRWKRRAELVHWSRGLKTDKPCTHCGESVHPVAILWDHIGTNKVVDVAEAVRKGWSRTRILAEIAKCELVCANCHAVRTYMRRAVAQLG